MEEQSVLDMVHELAEKVEASTIPYQNKRAIIEEIDVVWQLLWPWATEME